MCISSYSYLKSKQTSILKNFKGFWNVQKSIETSGDISVATLTHHILQGSEVLNPLQSGPECTPRDLELLIQMRTVGAQDIPGRRKIPPETKILQRKVSEALEIGSDLKA